MGAEPVIGATRQQSLAARIRGLASGRIAKFAAVGFSGVFVNLGCLYVLTRLAHVAERPSIVLAIAISMQWNFALNETFTFADKKADAHVGIANRLLRYNLVGLVGLGIQAGVAFLLNGLFVRMFHLAAPGPWLYVSQCIGIGVAMGWNFSSNFLWTWRQRSTAATPTSPPHR